MTPNGREPSHGCAVRLRAVSASLGGREILTGIDLDVRRGARLGIVGVNGAGKSTLLRVLAGILHPRAGEVWYADPDGTLRDSHDLSSRARARAIAYVAQDEVLQPELFVGEMVSLGRVPRSRPWSRGGSEERRIVLESLAAVGLADRVDSPCDQLSGGEHRRAVLARGLAQRCPVVLLDEPTNHLDVAWQLRLLATFDEQVETLVATIHDLDLALRHFDEIAVVGWPDGADRAEDPATIVALGPPAEVLSPDVLARQFSVGSIQITHPHLEQSHLLIHPEKDTQ